MGIFRYILVFIFVVTATVGFGLSEKDSLKAQLEQGEADTNMVLTLNQLYHIYSRDSLEVARVYAVNALQMARELEFGHGLSMSLSNIASSYYEQGLHSEALSFYKQALAQNEQLHNKGLIANSYNNIGLVHFRQADYAIALEFFMRCLKIQETLTDTLAIGNTYNNIGLINWKEKNYDEALKYYELYHQICLENGNMLRVGKAKNNMAIIYALKKNVPEAKRLFTEALEVKIAHGTSREIASAYSNLGEFHLQQDEFKEALKYFEFSFTLEKEINYIRGMSYTLMGMGKVRLKLNQWEQAEKELLRALEISEELSEKQIMCDILYTVGEMYKDKGMFEKAVGYFEDYAVLKDSIFSKSKTEQIANLESVYRAEKKEKELQLKKVLIESQQKELDHKQIQLGIISFGLLIAVILAALVVRAFFDKKKSNKILEEQNEVINTKSKSIASSIKYAKRIQQAVFPERNRIREMFPDSFILFQPRDVVSGDFYWFYRRGNDLLVAVVDCTGHGVPGAFMSLIGNELIKDIVVTNEIDDPGAVLGRLHTGIIGALGSNDSKQLDDGMDISFCKYSLDTQELSYSSCGRPIFFHQNGELIERKGLAFPLGMNIRKERSFKTESVKLAAGDSFYLFSDGITDQFGGEKGRKLSLDGFKRVINGVKEKPMREQETYLRDYFKSWRGNNAQIDDVCVIGVKV